MRDPRSAAREVPMDSVRSPRGYRTVGVVVLLTAMLPFLTSCGIPTGGAAETVEQAPSGVGPGNTDFDEEFEPNEDIEETVRYFLRASAGDSGSRDERLRHFTGDVNLEFSDSAEGLRLLEIDDVEVNQADDLLSGDAVVTGHVQGTYLPDGQVRMSSTPVEYEETFRLSRSSLTDPWSIIDAPSQVALTYFEFRRNYQSTSIYFLAPGEDRRLVPDLRWIYSNLDEEREHLTRLEWLVGGPSDWSNQSTRTAIPSGATPLDIDTDMPGEDLRVELEASASGDWDVESAEYMAAQIAWTLNMDASAELELVIDGTSRVDSPMSTWDHWNAIPPSSEPRDSYVVREGEVWELDLSTDRAHDSGDDEVWSDLEVGGIGQVEVGPDGHVAVIAADGNQLLVGEESEAFEEISGLPDGELSDLTWLSSSSFMVLSGNQVVHIEFGNDETTVQELPIPATDSITDLSVSPDGHRLAFIEDESAFVATLARDADGNHQIGEPRRVGLELEDVHDLVWSREYALMLVAESNDSDEWLFEVTIDNAISSEQSGTASFPMAQSIAAAPADPRDQLQSRGEPTVVVIGGNVYRVHSQNLEQIHNDQGEPLDGQAPFIGFP